jgi:IS6 family transposase
MDETYIRVKGGWKYLYRAVDSNGNTIDFMLSAKRNKKAAKRFLKKALGSKHNQIPRAITVDKNPAYPPAVNELKNDRILPKKVSLRQINLLSAGNLFFRNIFADSVFTGKHSIPETKHYCKNSSLFI